MTNNSNNKKKRRSTQLLLDLVESLVQLPDCANVDRVAAALLETVCPALDAGGALACEAVESIANFVLRLPLSDQQQQQQQQPLLR